MQLMNTLPMSPATSPRSSESPDDGQQTQCLLIPIKMLDDAGPAIAYAARRRDGGLPIRIALLHVEALVAPWPIRGEGQYVRARGKPNTGNVFAESQRILERLGIEYSTHLTSGPLVFSILDAAEQLACSEIIVRSPGRLHMRFLSQNIVSTLQTWQRAVPVITVNQRGIRQ